MLKFNRFYFIWAAVLFIAEVLIASYMHDDFIRPYFGDFLVVLLVYCFVKSFLNTPVLHTALGVLVFAYLVEASQYYNLVRILGLEQYSIARVVMGTYFSVVDLLCYTLGILFLLLLEKNNIKRQLITTGHG